MVEDDGWHEYGELSWADEADNVDPTSAFIATDSCCRSTPVEIYERSSCPHDISDHLMTINTLGENIWIPTWWYRSHSTVGRTTMLHIWAWTIWGENAQVWGLTPCRPITTATIYLHRGGWWFPQRVEEYPWSYEDCVSNSVSKVELPIPPERSVHSGP